MEPVWGEYGSGIALLWGLGRLTVRTVSFVKDWGKQHAGARDTRRSSGQALHIVLAVLHPLVPECAFRGNSKL